MPRKLKITNEQILEAAREAFLQQGFGASTLEIAQRADVSEASIFKRFSTKEELFFAAMGIPEIPPWVSEIESLSGKSNLKENLIYLCHKILEFYSEVMPRIMMVRSRGKDISGLRDIELAPIRDVKILFTFLEREMNQDRLRSCDAKAVAHILIGSLINYVLLKQMSLQGSMATAKLEQETFLNYEDSPTAISSFVQSIVEIIWQGIAPKHD